MANVTWTMKLYDLGGNAVTAADMTPAATVSNTIKHATNRKITYYLNGVDELEFGLFLDDPMALKVQKLKTTVKVWRTIVDDAGGALYSDPANEPAFAGLVTQDPKDGEGNIMNVKCFSPLWRLQSRFHLLNHYLDINPDTSSAYTQSELIWKLIDLVNNAFGSDSFTGISEGNFAWGAEPVMAPYFIARGSNTWTLIFEDLMKRAGGPDIVPRYHHTKRNPRLMYFDTEQKRGNDISASFGFNYHTGTDDNLDNITQEGIINPGEFANYYWAVGQGGPNSGKVVVRENNAASGYGYNAIGVYMQRSDYPDIKRIGVEGPPRTYLRAVSHAEFQQLRTPRENYTATVAEASGIYYKNDFELGDVVMLNADKGALQVSNKKQRIFQASLSMSDNNVEKPDVLIDDDFYGKVAT